MSKEEKNKVDRLLLDMMENFKYKPVELDNMIPNELYGRVGTKWKYALTTEKKIREGTLAQFMPKLNKKQIAKSMKELNNIFVPKRRVFLILKNKIENIVEERKN